MRRQLIFIFLFVLVSSVAIMSMAQDEQAATPITYGQVVTGEISNDVPEQFYSFEGSAGETLTVTMKATNREAQEIVLDSYVYVMDAAGETLAFDDDSAMNLDSLVGPVTLPADGTYTIIASRCCGRGRDGAASTGTYQLVMNPVDVIQVALGDSVPVTLTPDESTVFFAVPDLQETDIFAVGAERVAGDLNFGIRARMKDNLFIGEEVSQDRDRISFEPIVYVPDAGQILSVNIYPNGEQPLTGELTVNLSARLVETTPLVLGEEISGVISDEAPADYYTFSANDMELFRLAGSQEGDYPIEVGIYGPSVMPLLFYQMGMGGGMGMEPAFVSDPLPYYGAGKYLMMVKRGVGYDDRRGAGTVLPYSLTLEHTQITMLTSGNAVRDQVGENVYDKSYYFAGAAGQSFSLTMQNQSEAYGIGVDVSGKYGSNNPTMLNFSAPNGGTVTYNGTLEQDGLYIVRVYNTNYVPDLGITPTGAFEMMIELGE